MEILAYKRVGTGKKSIIFLHELFGDCTNYDSIIPFLDKENFSCYFVDLRGYGLSKNILGIYNLDEAVKDVINLISHLKIESYNLVAHSMSTMIAQHISSKDNRAKQLILITPISYKGVKSTQKAKENLLSQMRKDSKKIEEIVEQSSIRYNQTWKNYRINLALNCSILEARLGYMNMYLNINFEEDNKIDINIPIKILTGKYDFPVFSKNEVAKYFQKFNNVEIIEVEESGHYPMIECPVFFASKIESWYDF
ncbi:alpha/beta fold hydrolase [Aliarcobacter vitoriensis]|uniref:Alpha/beta hydrolase n=1 Tax=Aliarcobacter vitoriensis TaxID=2011099 RepID=A0A366MUH7_9BACT|nr:alpha/beta hydrolase [Aliarcobacter vitoriensis]RBQ29717.1 alpha/beta hydrolase [Aliarcobacter vitoriensis]